MEALTILVCSCRVRLILTPATLSKYGLAPQHQRLNLGNLSFAILCILTRLTFADKPNKVGEVGYGASTSCPHQAPTVPARPDFPSTFHSYRRSLDPRLGHLRPGEDPGVVDGPSALPNDVADAARDSRGQPQLRGHRHAGPLRARVDQRRCAACCYVCARAHAAVRQARAGASMRTPT